MRVGDLKHFITFQAPAKDANGLITWQTIFTCKGAWWGLSAQEQVAAMNMGGNITGKIRIQYHPARIRSSWRVLVDNNYILNLVGPPVNIGGDNRWLEMRVKQVE